MRKDWKKIAVLASLALGMAVVTPVVSRAEDAKDGKESKEGKEVKMKLAECPQAVQDTLAKEAKGAKKAIETVDKETAKDGTVTYEADAVLEDGKNYQIKVAADGKLISKTIDNEESEQKGDNNEEKEEKK
jgi:hypothetical protein